MNDEKLYQLLVQRMQEVAVVPPQTVGPLTPLYKRVVPQLKWQPWRSVAAVSFVATIALYILFGVRVVHLASLLQYGF